MTPPTDSADLRHADAYRVLTRREAVLGELAGRFGQPDPFRWIAASRTGTSNFAALLMHIVGQQISIAAAFTVFDRISAAAGRVPRPEDIVELGADRLRALGMSRAKAGYLVCLADAQLSGTVDVDGLDELTDEQAVAALTIVRGIGQWSAEMFLIHQLHRPDVFPAGDLGLRKAIQTSWTLGELPSIKEVQLRAQAWAPLRSYASALLWASLGLAS